MAVIAGTGVIDHFGVSAPVEVETEFGKTVVHPSKDGTYYLLPRHGLGHNVPPHRINYRANIAGLRKLGVGTIIASSAVGSMEPRLRVGNLGLVSQFIDFTRGRQETFHDDEPVHVDMTNPYSRNLNAEIVAAANSLGLSLRTGLVYVCAEGPRYETTAEIKMFRNLGGDVVGMTGVPEVVLAREAGMEYSSVVVATNWAAGIQEKVSHQEVLKVMNQSGADVRNLIEATIRRLTQRGRPA